MSEQTRYRILFRDTTGFDLIREDACNLTKEKCDERIEYHLSLGVSPDRIRAVVDNREDV